MDVDIDIDGFLDFSFDDDMFLSYTDGLDEMPDYICMNHQTTTTENHDDDETDRISDMPDYILCKILSCLPTKDAMAAKILSTRWGTLFPFFWVPPIVLDIDDSFLYRKYNHKTHFEKFMDQLLHETLSCVHTLNLRCSRYNSEKKISWVNAALRLNVRELSLQLRLCGVLDEEETLFASINGYKGLTRLELPKGFCSSSVSFPDGFTLPNLETLVITSESREPCYIGNGFSLPKLKMLVLSDVEFWINNDSEMPLEKLLDGCPALEHLMFKFCTIGHYPGNLIFSLSIRNPLLKNLTMEDCKGIWLCSLEIDTPNLEVLICKGHAAASYSVSHFKSLVSADIDVEFSYLAAGIEEFIKACSSTAHLRLSAYAIEALHIARVELPIFKNLTRLELGYVQLDGWKILARLLCNAPNLQKLTFKQGFCLQSGGYPSFESFMANHPPDCLERHLKEIEFYVFDGREDEIKLVEYFLTNGNVIEAVKLHCVPFKNKSPLRRRLCKLPRHSKLVFQFR